MDMERVQPSLQPTGDPRVDQAIAGLAALDDLPLDERPAALEAVHDRLREILGELGDPARPAGTGPAGTGTAGSGPAGFGTGPRPGEPGRRGEQGQLSGGPAPDQRQGQGGDQRR
jgi:hypothetical protein